MTYGADVDHARRRDATGGDGTRLLSVSDAARMLGVSPSSLRAWAAAGLVPHVRTPGGHRRFEVQELVRWLAVRGGSPPAPQQRLQELVPTRIGASPDVADALAGAGPEVLQAFEDELARVRPPGAVRPSLARRTRVLASLDSLAEAMRSGDLANCYRDAEWEGLRHGAQGKPGDVPVTEALALRRAVDRVLAPMLGDGRPERRTVERSLDRMAVRVAAGYAEGVRLRMRSPAE